MRIARLTAVGIAGGALLVLAAPLAASAHVTVTPSGTAAGSSSVLTFAFGHGCDGSPTTRLTIDIPESIMAVSPTLHPNWTIEKIEDGDRIARVVYTAITPVEDGFRDAIDLSVQLPQGAAGETLVFPVLQTCAEGETNWNELAEEGASEPESPAPTILVTEATGDEHGSASHDPGATEHDDHDESDEAADAAATTGSEDVIARVLGIGGLVIGVVGIVLALGARRPRSDA